jgi:hypothetical protein
MKKASYLWRPFLIYHLIFPIMKKQSLFLILSIFAIFIGGCKYDFITPDYVPPVPPGVSFSEQVAPIFSTGDKCTQCHMPGGQSPDLTPANAYSQIVPSLVNTASPEASIILSVPGSASHSWKGYTATESATILAWITEGAKNN